tara:strand:+ start:122 stop:5881 length:5760 start_codon:yes stop_codon:yes gene_type:complete
MPEIKNTFTSGKMNKDLDERLVPKGQYRDAMNIQISTSEGSDIGAVENVLGNLLLTNGTDPFLIPEQSVCVGAVADEKNDTFYWFTAHANKDAILKYDRNTGSVSPVLIDINKNVLNFNPLFLITAINVLDDLLLWTDNRSEPKKINIGLCEQGTNANGAWHTRLIVPARNITYNAAPDITEENVTVIKKSPKQKLLLQEVYQEYNPSRASASFTDANGEPLALGHRHIIEFTDFTLSQKYNAGDIITLALLSDDVSLPEQSQIRIELEEDVSGQPGPLGSTYLSNVFIYRIVAIASGVAPGVKSWECLKLVEDEVLFERKFPRFSYRYKYQDGEYSTFAPFTDVVFKAKKFEYNAFKAYNTGMENRLQSLKLRNFITPETPMDVVQVDILYKESNSPSVYIVDKIKYNDYKDITVGITAADNSLVNSWHGNVYEIKSDIIYAVLPNNQLLRQYDNVPRLALAQEVTGNRIVYGNYLQNYDILDNNNNIFVPAMKSSYVTRFESNVEYKQEFTGNLTGAPFLVEGPVLPYFGHKSLKSMRNYQVGLTYLDKYGRETPVFSNNKSVFEIPKKHGGFKTKIAGQVLTQAPSWAESFKVYVKETSTEYYNMAMSRVYRAEDGNIWLAFPSAERNKIDEDTFLILKKGFDSNELVKEKAKYKVLAIENEAPDYIKTETSILGEVVTSPPGGTGYIHEVNTPTVDSRYVSFDKSVWTDSNAGALTEVSDSMRVEWQSNDGFYTSQYEISSVTGGDVASLEYNVTLTETFKDADSWIYPSYPTNVDFDDIKGSLTVRVLKDTIVNRPEFDGVFFVKINSDDISEKFVFGNDGVVNYEVQNKLYTHYLSDTLALQAQGFTDPGTTQAANAAYTTPVVSNSKDEWKNLLRFGGDTANPKGGSTTSGATAGFFIDQLFYRGVHYDTPDEELGQATISDGFSNSNGANHWTTTGFSRHNYSYQNRNGYGKGVFTENGKHYVELSFGKIGDGPSVRGSGQFDVQDDAVRLNYTGWPDGLGMHSNKIWQPTWEKSIQVYKETYGGRENELSEIVDKIRAGQSFKIQGNDVDEVFKILSVDKIKRYNHTNFRKVFEAASKFLSNTTYTETNTLNSNLSYSSQFQNIITQEEANDIWKEFQQANNRRITYRIELNKDISEVKIGGAPLLERDSSTGVGTNTGVSSNFPIQFITPRYSVARKQIISENPAIWETEPKDSAELDIYYEASDCIPLTINNRNFKRFIPIGSVVTCPSKQGVMNPYVTTTVTGYDNGYIYLSTEIDTAEYQGVQSNVYQRPPYLVFTRPDTSYTTLTINAASWNFGDGAKYEVVQEVHNNPFAISWFNCYSFVNGVESNRVRDTFNSITLDKGAKASSTLDETYEQERRGSGLIYSGIYNSTSGINDLNQFIQAEKITKDLNPSYGSIQKLYQRRVNLIAFCEDKVIKILSNKDALFNADGNPQLIATNRVLGEANPFSGDYGISTNPESFSKDNYRAYFTDKQRGAVLRLSMDGLTAISEYGMSDYFKDNLKNNNRLIGSYDDKKNNYNLTLENNQTTISFDEKVNGWSSFKSFVPEVGISMANDYYTFKKGLAWMHHSENNNAERNTFYKRYGGNAYPFKSSSVSFLLNDSPSLVKSYKTIGYEGSQSNVNQETTNIETGYYNLSNKNGWKLDSIVTDVKVETGKALQDGYINEFIKKENKWFNYIKSNDVSQTLDIKTDQFSFQGIGRAVSISIDNSLYNVSVTNVVQGCMDIDASNYDASATVDNGTCIYDPLVAGCTDSTADNYNPLAQVDDGSCLFNISGCTDSNANNYNSQATVDDGSCTFGPSGPIYGCTDSTALNYDPLATVDNGTCILGIPGCIDPLADNYNASANVDNGSCTYTIGPGPSGGGGGGNPSAQGCTDPLALNFDPAAASDDGSCVYPTLTIQDTNDDD